MQKFFLSNLKKSAKATVFKSYHSIYSSDLQDNGKDITFNWTVKQLAYVFS